MTLAEKFVHDARVLEAKRVILSALTAAQTEMKGVKPADPQKKITYGQLIATFSALRGGTLYYPYLGSGLGNRVLVELLDGSIKYDFITGIGVHYFGHSFPALVERALEAALSDTIMEGNLEQNADSVAFAQTLLATANKNTPRFSHCFISSSGVMAGENALKIAFQRRHPAKRVLCFENCFMGRTLFMSAMTDNPNNRVGLPQTAQVDYVPFFDEALPKESTEKAIATVKNHLHAHPGDYAAMCFELVLGEGGFYAGDKEFFRQLMTVLKNEGIPVLVDEVQTFLRTHEPFAFQHFGLTDLVDCVWVGKASQACATLFTQELNPKPNLLSQTYTASASAIRAGQFIIDTAISQGLFGESGKIARLHTQFVEALKKLGGKHAGAISGPFGLGGMMAFTPFDGSEGLVKRLLKDLFENGLIAFSCGKVPKRLRFLPPLGVVTEQDIDAAINILDQTLCSFAR